MESNLLMSRIFQFLQQDCAKLRKESVVLNENENF